MKEPKSKAGIREVVVMQAGVEPLRRAYQEAAGRLFTTEHGSTPTSQNFNHKEWKPMKQRTGLDWRFHDLRHTYATLLIQSGLGQVELCQMMGHSRPSVTYDIYAGFFGNPVEDVWAKLRGGE